MPPDAPTSPDSPAPDSPESLTPRQVRFCSFYLTASTGAEAARLAGYQDGNARTQAWRLLQDRRVRQRIEALRRERGLAAPRHALELLAKLERLYDAAAYQGDVRNAVHVVEAMARLYARFGVGLLDSDDPAGDADLDDPAAQPPVTFDTPRPTWRPRLRQGAAAPPAADRPEQDAVSAAELDGLLARVQAEIAKADAADADADGVRLQADAGPTRGGRSAADRPAFADEC